MGDRKSFNRKEQILKRRRVNCSLRAQCSEDFAYETGNNVDSSKLKIVNSNDYDDFNTHHAHRSFYAEQNNSEVTNK